MTLDIQMADSKERIDRLRQLMIEDHILIFGDMDFLQFIEHKFYMDGNNDQFKLIFDGSVQDRIITVFAAAQKTDDLIEFLKINDSEISNNLLAIINEFTTDGFMGVRQLIAKESMGKIEGIENLLQDLFINGGDSI